MTAATDPANLAPGGGNDLAGPLAPRPIACWGAAALVFVVALLCYLPWPFNDPLAGTEGHRAMAAHNMVTSGQWLVPQLFGRIYLAKPPLHYWIQGTCEALSGSTSPLVWRLPAAIEGAILAAILSLFAGRWFGGRLPALATGLAYVALFTLWGENRGADIDVTNTLAATLASLCLIELHHGSPRRRWPWALGVALALGATWMAKGPGGLPIILGTLIFAAILRIRADGPRWLLQPATWLPILVGCAMFGAYAGAAYWYLTSHHLPLDLSGVQEGLQDAQRHQWKIKPLLESLALPPTMFGYAMPVSLALPLALSRKIRGDDDPRAARLTLALAGSLLAGWGVCVLTGMHLPRYAYPTLPLLCPLAGAVAARVPRLAPRSPAWSWVAGCFIAGVAIVAVGAMIMTGLLFKRPPTAELQAEFALPTIPLAITGATICAAASAWIIGRLQRSADWRAACAVPLLLLSATTCFGCFVHFERLRRTSLPQARLMRQIVGEHGRVTTNQMVLDQPELFYYSGLPTRATDGPALRWEDVPSGEWVVLEEPELKEWIAKVPLRLGRTIKLVCNKNTGYLIQTTGQ